MKIDKNMAFLMLFYTLKILRWSILGCAGLLVIWIIGGHWWASQSAKEIEEAIAEFRERYPDRETNDSALQLHALTARLGLLPFAGDLSSSTSAYLRIQSPFAPSKEEHQKWRKISSELDIYLNEQIFQPDETIAPPPESLQLYLQNNIRELETIQNYILNHESPQWSRDITSGLEGDRQALVPTFIGLHHLQKILALDILEKERLGDREAVLKTLEASWKLNHLLKDRYSLYSSLLAIGIGKYQIGVMRKLDRLPSHWQKRLFERDLRRSMLETLATEAIYNVVYIYNYHSFADEEVTISRDSTLKTLGYLDFISKPYFTVSAIDTWKFYLDTFSKVEQHNICFESNYDISKPARWNLPGNKYGVLLIDQLRKAEAYMLNVELTQKILKIKELALQQGKWPQSVPDLESEICPGATWIYQVTDDGQMSLSLSHTTDTLLIMQQKKETEHTKLYPRPKQVFSTALPLEYKTRKIPQP
ncbi:MAG: hypothetical protein AB4290_20025 [Spirulina sp.]